MNPRLKKLENSAPHVIAWESTVACNLVCVHCRASAQCEPAPDELATEEVRALIDSIVSFSRPIFVISGGEPLMRPDIFDIADYATARGLRVAMSPNGTLITPQVVEKMKDAGVQRISVSMAIQGLEACRAGGLGFQLNTTVLRQTMDDLPAMHRLASELGAVAWHVFMLVPTGRGRVDDEVSPQQYEAVLEWVYQTARTSPLPIRVTCGPHFMRIVAQNRRQDGDLPNLVRQRGREDQQGLDALSRGCLAGVGYCFISHKGDVYPCGYLPILAGNVREQPFQDIYQQSPLFRTLRDLEQLHGKCGHCEFVRICGGCRARAYGITGDYLAEEPYCIYQPKERAKR